MNFRKLLVYFLSWRLLLFVILYLSISTVPLRMQLLGGGLSNYLRNPHLFSWLNFDGEHYLLIAQYGYSPLNYFFFPLYPYLVRIISQFSNDSIISLAKSGLLFSNIMFATGLIGLVKLVEIDYTKEVVKLTLILLLLFPTSFFFGSYYTESLFFALTVWSFYFARRGNWLTAGMLGALSTATRVVGLALIPALIIEAYTKNGRFGKVRRIGWRNMFGILLIPMGLLLYMLYLKRVTGDPLEFLNSVGVFGEQRSSSFVILPQVFYRYIVKIIPNINYNYFPAVFTTWIELLTAVLFGALGIVGLLGAIRKLKNIKLRLSYAVYLLAGYLIPTLSGSFSSLPRYVLVLFPAFILLADYLKDIRKPIQYVILAILLIGMWISTSLFVRGYWVS